MSLTNGQAADSAQRALRAQDILRDIDDIRSDIRVALLDISREAMYGLHRAALETTLGLTLSAADANGVQTVAVTGTVFEESVEICDDVYHTGIKLEHKPDIGHLLRLLSTSTVPCYTVVGVTLSVRRPSAILAVTAAALKVKAVLQLTAIASLPATMEHLLIQRLVSMGGGTVEASEPKAT